MVQVMNAERVLGIDRCGSGGYREIRRKSSAADPLNGAAYIHVVKGDGFSKHGMHST